MSLLSITFKNVNNSIVYYNNKKREKISDYVLMYTLCSLLRLRNF